MAKAYIELLKDPRWQRKRLEILQRDNWTCVHCGDDSVCLHIHHKQYFKGLNPWEYSDKYLETLCEECHQITHVGKEINIDILHIEEKMTEGEIGLSRLFALEFYRLRQSMSIQQLRRIYSQLESTLHGK